NARSRSRQPAWPARRLAGAVRAVGFRRRERARVHADIRVARLTNPAAAAARPKLALILSGGGARAAYQAGVARAIAEMLPDGSASPFRIVCGTSAGAINAAALAAGARHFRAASTMLCATWSTLRIDDIYRADGWHLT